MGILKDETDLYIIECDNCGDEEGTFESFEDALDFKRDRVYGWRSRRCNGDWEDLCPDCAEEEGLL